MFFDLVKKEILDNYTWAMINPGNRRNIINFLNSKFFSDGIAEFVDITTDLDIDINSIGVAVKYRNIQYNMVEFEKFYLKIERMRKLNRINGKQNWFIENI